MKKELANEEIDISKYLILMDVISSRLDLKGIVKLGEKMKSNVIDPYTRFTSYLILRYAEAIREENSLSYNKQEVTEPSDYLMEYVNTLGEDKKKDAMNIISRPKIIDLVSDFFTSKVIDIDEAVAKNLAKTKNKIYFRNCPFQSMMIPLNLVIEDRFEIFSVILTDTFVINENKEAINFTIFGIDRKDGKDFFRSNCIYNEGILNRNYSNEIFNKKEEMTLDNYVANLIVNILDFMNHPDVETKIIKWPNNQKRQSRGQLPINDKVRINITGKLYKQIYEEERIKDGKEINCKFWVRGHFLHFWNKTRYNRLYNMNQEEMKRSDYYIDGAGIVSKWVLPYIKGRGELKNKSYIVKKE